MSTRERVRVRLTQYRTWRCCWDNSRRRIRRTILFCQYVSRQSVVQRPAAIGVAQLTKLIHGVDTLPSAENNRGPAHLVTIRARNGTRLHTRGAQVHGTRLESPALDTQLTPGTDARTGADTGTGSAGVQVVRRLTAGCLLAEGNDLVCAPSTTYAEGLRLGEGAEDVESNVLGSRVGAHVEAVRNAVDGGLAGHIAKGNVIIAGLDLVVGVDVLDLAGSMVSSMARTPGSTDIPCRCQWGTLMGWMGLQPQGVLDRGSKQRLGLQRDRYTPRRGRWRRRRTG